MKSSNQLQREAEIHRRELSDSLDGLRAAATPSYVTTEVMNLAKDSTISIAKALAEQARANPIPALLIGAGLVMMLTRSASGSANAADRGRDLLDKAGQALKSAPGTGAVRDAANSVQRTAHDTAHRASDLASDVTRRAADAASGVSDTVSSVAQNVGSTAHNTLSKAGELGSAALDTARTTAGQVRDGVASTTSGLVQQGQQTARQLSGQAHQMSGNARNYVSTMAEEQPIVVAALGAAIGAAIGAALPMTEAERQYLGSTSSRVSQAGRDTTSKVAEVVKSETVGDDLGAKVNEVTGKVVSAVTQELSGARSDSHNENTQSQST